MAESRLVPCNIMSWPRIVALLPDQKLIFVHLWLNAATNSAGCYLYPMGSAAGELSLSAPSLAEALRRFQKDGLIDIDDSTGEVMIMDWFRWHTFRGVRHNILESDIKKIQSERLKNATLEKSASCRASTRQVEDKLKTPPHARQRAESKNKSDPQSPMASGGVLENLAIEPNLIKYSPQLIACISQAGITDTVYAQDLLDELAGRIDAGNRGEQPKVGNPVLWLQRVAAGEFKRGHCFEVQARRNTVKANAQQATHQQASRAAVLGPIRAARDYFNALDDASRDKLIEQFSSFLSSSNPAIFQFFRKSGIETKAVQTELFNFITDTILSVSTEEAMA